MTDAIADLLRRLENSVKGEAPPDVEVVEQPPFRAWLNQATDLVWLTYAMPMQPLDSAERAAEAVARLRHDFGVRNRVLRFEFMAELWPELPPVLEASGLVVQARQPVMACWPSDFRPYTNPSLDVVLLDPEDSNALITFQRIQALGFGEEYDDGSDPTSPASVANLAARLRSGLALAVVGMLAGETVGAGVLTPNGSTAELVGIVTVPARRRLGVATTVCTFLVERYFRQGGEIVWLSAEDSVAQSVYEKIGFRVVGSLLNYIDSRDAST